MRTITVVGLAAALVGCQVARVAVPTQTAAMAYVDAAPGLGFPRPEAEILRWVASEDVPAMRRHGWEVWAAIAQPAPSGFPAFLTWFQVEETFGAKPVGADRRFDPEFRVPSQKTHAILSFNVYNAPLRDHVRGHGYPSKAALRALAGRATDVADFPATAVMLKTVWWPVRPDGLTAFPVWDATPTRPIEWGRAVTDRVRLGAFAHWSAEARAELTRHEEDGNDFETFARVVAIDPARSAVPAGETAEVRFFDPADTSLQKTLGRRGRVVPLARLFHVRITDPATVRWLRQLPLIDELTDRVWGRPFEVGDCVAFVAAHVSHAGDPRLGVGHGLVARRAGSGPLRRRSSGQRAGCLPPLPDGCRPTATCPRSPPIAFNPYLEGAFSEGPRSNCVACHQRAVMGPTAPGRSSR